MTSEELKAFYRNFASLVLFTNKILYNLRVQAFFKATFYKIISKNLTKVKIWECQTLPLEKLG